MGGGGFSCAKCCEIVVAFSSARLLSRNVIVCVRCLVRLSRSSFAGNSQGVEKRRQRCAPRPVGLFSCHGFPSWSRTRHIARLFYFLVCWFLSFRGTAMFVCFFSSQNRLCIGAGLNLQRAMLSRWVLTTSVWRRRTMFFWGNNRNTCRASPLVLGITG